MDDLPQRLEAVGRTELARLLRRHGRIPLADYARGLWAHRPRVPLEPALRAAFARALPEGLAGELLGDLEARRVLQTATHLTASEGPTFLAVHALASAGLEAGAPYLVGAFSGVPFSNSAWSGCLNYSARHPLQRLVREGGAWHGRLLKDERNRAADTGRAAVEDRRISLIPARMRDGLVYGARVPERMREILAELAPEFEALSPGAPGDDFGLWALGFCARVTRRVLGRPAIYLDLNRILADYLEAVLPDAGHPLHRILFDRALAERVTAALGGPPILFYAGYEQGKRQRVAGLTAAGEGLIGAAGSWDRHPEAIGEALAAGRLCPGLFLTFLTLSFVNGFCCLGSFEQVEYLHRFRRALSGLGLFEEAGLDPAALDGLTTGRALSPADGRPVYPLDVVLGTPFSYDLTQPLLDWIAPLLPRLLGA